MTSDGTLSFLAGGGEMGERTRVMDWSKTPLGQPTSWSPALQMMVSFLLANRFPLLLWWGPQYISIYNDAYRPVLGTKHPRALGLPCSECWSEIWSVLKPLIDSPFNGGPPTWMDDFELEVNRHGFVEETHFTVAYSPVPDRDAKDGIGGVLATVHEITEKVVGERRIAALRDLAASPGELKTAEEACRIAAESLAKHSKDIPFSLIYLIDSSRKTAKLAGAAGIAPGADAAPVQLALDATAGVPKWPFAEVVQSETTITVENLCSRFSDVPSGQWSDPPHTGMVIPIESNIAHQLSGFLVAGVSPRLRFDNQYRSFLELAATQIAAAIANARAYEEERKRAEALAEIDRAKTLFFSNVSHEFRTPLTLMLGPLEDALASSRLLQEEREKLDTAHRNSLRLLKLVNSLLDFSRIEAGRATANYESVDLAKLTGDLASNFRSACERAGLRLVVDCPPLCKPVYVDRDMWEKIVLNLLSNAFKFTFEGEIALRLRTANGHVELCVQDTGVGIPTSELPRLFERFHRIEGQKSRTYEGSGIGLALVQELAKLHGGSIRADSVEGVGTTLTVTVPFGRSHLPEQRVEVDRKVASAVVRNQAYVEEALRWLPDAAAPSVTRPASPEDLQAPLTEHELPFKNARILVADDNSDMRDYVRNLLAARWEVETVSDGQAALEAIRRERPDILLTDVMMPQLDGIGLLRAIRADPALADLPVILLSARADEEAKLYGLDSGADEYLVKPFNSRELLTRIAATLKLAQLRKDVAADLRDMQRLLEVGARCVRAGNHFEECLDEILNTAIDILGADKGNIQLRDSKSGKLTIAAQKGFEEPFLSFFAEVDEQEASVCGKALDAHERVVVEDVTQSEIFLGTPALEVLLSADVHAVQSTPLVGGSGRVSGMISAHFAKPHRPTARELRILDLLARQAADYLERKQDEVLRKRAEMNVLGQKRILEMVATGKPLQETLASLMLLIEELEPAIHSNILLVSEDGSHLRRCSGPNMPEEFHCAVDGASIFPPYVGTCSEVAHRGAAIISPDLAKETRYATEWRDLMVACGVRAVRSTPVFGSDGRVLASLAICFDHPCNTDPTNPHLIDIGTHLAAIAIERHRARVTLEHQTQQITTLLNKAPVGVYLVDSQFRIREVNPTAEGVFGEISGGVVGRDINEIIRILWEKPYADEISQIFRHTLETGESYSTPQRAEMRADRKVIEYYEWRLDRIALPDGTFGLVCYFRDISERVQAETTRELLLRELNHRVKNTLASVQAIAQQTVRTTHEPADFAERFSGRIQSLARVHSLLTESTWHGADLRELIRDQLLQGSIDETRLTAWGPAVHLESQTAVHMALMLHELGTNSVKYGALSTSKGWVTVRWTVDTNLLTLEWVERGGPGVSAPSKRGFGTTLIERSAKGSGGRAHMRYEPEGITWNISLELPEEQASDASPAVVRPESATESVETKRKVAERKSPLSGLRILVVEDEPLIAMDLVDRLEGAGAQVPSQVGNEKDALQILESEEFDGALLDANLHGQSANEIAAALTRRNVPFVFVTGYGRAGLPIGHEQAPVLSKPVNDQQLFEAVASVVKRKRVVRLKN